MHNSLDVLIACLNEENTIEKVIREHHHVLKNQTIFENFKITVLDDGSSDKSLEIISELGEKLSNVTFITSLSPSGIHNAFNRLVESSNQDWVYFTSGDDQFPAEILKDIIKSFDPDYEVIIAKRVNKIEIYNLARLTISTFYRLLAYFVSGVDPIDAGSTKLIKRTILNEQFFCHYLAIDAEIIIKTIKEGKSIKVVNCEFGSRKNGKSSAVKTGVLWKSFVDTLRLYKYRFL
jgi:dolichol-phosphate mannosyltransferase